MFILAFHEKHGLIGFQSFSYRVRRQEVSGSILLVNSLSHRLNVTLIFFWTGPTPSSHGSACVLIVLVSALYLFQLRDIFRIHPDTLGKPTNFLNGLATFSPYPRLLNPNSVQDRTTMIPTLSCIKASWQHSRSAWASWIRWIKLYVILLNIFA